MLGQALAYAPNVNSAMLSAGRLMKLLDRTPKMHNPSNSYHSTIEVAMNNSGSKFYLTILFYYRITKAILNTPTLNSAILHDLRSLFYRGLTWKSSKETPWPWLDHLDVANQLAFSCSYATMTQTVAKLYVSITLFSYLANCTYLTIITGH